MQSFTNLPIANSTKTFGTLAHLMSTIENGTEWSMNIYIDTYTLSKIQYLMK